MDPYAPRSLEEFGYPTVFLAPRRITSVTKSQPKVKEDRQQGWSKYQLHIACGGINIPLPFYSGEEEIMDACFRWACDCIRSSNTD